MQQHPPQYPDIDPIEAESVTSRPRQVQRWITAGAVVTVFLLLAVFAAGTLPGEGEHIGFWSVLPAVTTLVLVFLTREVVSSLLAGIAVAGVVSGEFNIIRAFLMPAIGSEQYALILLVYLWALGGLIGLWTRTGGAVVFADWAGAHIVRGPRSARFFAWLMGMVFHQGGTISTVLAGTTVRPVTDRHRVSHEELTYIVDSTASPVATIIPFNAWPLYVGGLIVGTIPLFETTDDAVAFFFAALPYNFYGIFAVAATLLFALSLLPWVGGRMRRATERARTTGELNAPGAKPLAADELTQLRVPDEYRAGLIDFLLPMGALLGVAIIPYLAARLTGAAGTVYIAEAFGVAVLVAFVVAIAKGMTVHQAIDGFIDGCKGVTIGAVVLGLAVALGYVSGQLGTANYIVEATRSLINPVFLPAILMAICMAVSFSIGSSWGTYAVVFPIAMPLAWAIMPEASYISLCFGAVLGGAVFGDQCSPISDTTILSALACGGDLMDHVTTQLPLALAAAALAGVAATIVALMIV
jgi:Na+/H+ antiporter NhaC